MGSEWRECRLGELAEIYDGPHATPKTVPEGPIFLGISCLDRGRLDLSKAEHLTEADLGRWTRRVTPTANDVVFSYETRIGEAAKIPPGFRGCLGRRMGLLRPRAIVDPDFLLYALLGPDFQETLRSRTVHGSTVDRILLTELGDFPIRVPPLTEQRHIAAALKALDDKIELNRRMSQTLESMARVLFKSWFVDFDPVRAKAEGRDTGLPQRIADLFPSSLSNSELGEIPDGWEIQLLGESVDLVRGRSYTSEELTESDTALVTLKSFARGGGYRPDGLKSFSGSYKAAQVVTPGELVVACTDVTQAAEVIGRPAIVRGTGEYTRLVASLDTMIVRPRSASMTRGFLYLLGGTDAFVAHTYAHTTGTTVLHLAAGAIPSFSFACPPAALVHCFDSVASPALDRIQSLEEEADSLARLRDALLPRLLLAGTDNAASAETIQ